MKINRLKLLAALKEISPAIQQTSSRPVLENVLFKNGKVTGTNLELTVIVNIDAEEGLIPFKLLNALISVCKNSEIDLFKQNNLWILKDGKAVHKIGIATDDANFPVIPEFKKESEINLGSNGVQHLKNAIKFQGQEGISTEGCFIGKDIVGTNSFIMYKHNLDAECKLHVPASFIALLPGTDCKLNYNNNFCSIETAQSIIITRLLETKYPDYSVVFKSGIEFNAEVALLDLSQQLKKILAFSPVIPVASFEFGNGVIRIFYEDDKNNSYEDEIEFTGSGKCAAKFNVSIFQTLLSVLQSERIEIAMTEFNRAFYIREKDNQNTITLIMPFYEQAK